MNFKKFYINGDFRMLGSRNLYGRWNTLMYNVHIQVNYHIAVYYMKTKKSFYHGRIAFRLRKAIQEEKRYVYPFK